MMNSVAARLLSLMVLAMAAVTTTNASNVYVSHGDLGKGQLVEGSSGAIVYDTNGSNTTRTASQAAHEADSFAFDNDPNKIEPHEVDLPKIKVVEESATSESSIEASDDKPSVLAILSALFVPIFVICATFVVVSRLRRKEQQRNMMRNINATMIVDDDDGHRNLYDLGGLPAHGYAMKNNKLSGALDQEPRGFRNIV